GETAGWWAGADRSRHRSQADLQVAAAGTGIQEALEHLRWWQPGSGRRPQVVGTAGHRAPRRQGGRVGAPGPGPTTPSGGQVPAAPRRGSRFGPAVRSDAETYDGLQGARHLY